MAKPSTPVRSSFPYWATEANNQPSRFKPAPTPTSMRQRSLFGIPMKSSFTGEAVSDAQIQGFIDEAISEVEHLLDIYITPTEFSERLDYDREMWTQSYAYLKLRHPNVIKVLDFQLRFSNEDTDEDDGQDLHRSIIDIPKEFIHVEPQDGVLQLVPAFGTTLSGFIVSAMSGHAFWAIANTQGAFPGAVRVRYLAGFEEGKIPAMIAGLIEVVAAYKLLSILGPILFPHNSVSISIDGVSQGTSTPGPAFLKQRLDELEKIRESMLDTARGYYQRKFLIDQI